MKNKEPFVVIPQYLFDELIEYFDNKSDADNGTPNKEKKLLSQLQEEYSLRESKGCEWVKASNRLPELYQTAAARKNGLYGEIKRDERLIQFSWFGGVDSYKIKSGNLSSIEWLDESSNSTDELRKEVERLKGLIDVAFKHYYMRGFPHNGVEEELREFKTENKL